MEVKRKKKPKRTDWNFTRRWWWCPRENDDPNRMGRGCRPIATPSSDPTHVAPTQPRPNTRKRRGWQPLPATMPVDLPKHPPPTTPHFSSLFLKRNNQDEGGGRGARDEKRKRKGRRRRMGRKFLRGEGYIGGNNYDRVLTNRWM